MDIEEFRIADLHQGTAAVFTLTKKFSGRKKTTPLN